MQITNPVTPQNTPYWQEIRKLNKDEKIRLLALISTSLVEDSQSQATSLTKNEEELADEGMDRLMKNCFGAWKGDETAEQIIANIRESRHSASEPVQF
jgi:hypothetical protein